MNFKLRKKCKLNMIVAVIMCVSLLFCFCSTSIVKASDNLGTNYTNYVAFKNLLAKQGYMTSYNHDNEGWSFPDYDLVKKELTLSDLPSIWAWSNDNYKLPWNDFVSHSGASSFDVYSIFGSTTFTYTDGGKTYRRPNQWYVIVPSGSTICWGKNVETTVPEDCWQQNFLEVATDAEGLFAFKLERWKGSDPQYSYYVSGWGDYENNTVSYSCKFKQDDVTFFNLGTGNDGDVSAPFIFTNMPTVNVKGQGDRSSMIKFVKGDKSLATNADSSWSDKKEYPAESFYWDDMTCKVARIGQADNKSRYAFSFKYNYSCPLMLDTSEMFNCKVIYNVDVAWKDGKGRTYTYSDSKEDTFNLNKHRNGYVNDKIYLNGEIGFGNRKVEVAAALDYLTCFCPNNLGGSNLDKITQSEVTSAKLYVTVFLYHVPDPDTLFSNPDIVQSAKNNYIQSTDVRYFPFDLYTLKEDEEVASKKPIVTTEDVTDDDGNVTDKKVTDVVATDDSGKTVINITIDNSNKVIDNNANVNTGGGSGSGDGDDEDKNTKSFWKYVSGIVALFTALLNSDSGLFAVIASYFKFIPKDFWSVTIGAIVVIAVLSIYRLAKKGG
ncbi:hypothetical protein DWX94_14290 [Coprococcus eutactus]|uniref:Uncharacterized protein n=1 Tax=Coprococcus eutactus TaxID=33043 RepID=A0A3R5ZM16_9FIRM|nr:hypothetical protein DWX94_14290 [Coprococcus eutactus]